MFYPAVVDEFGWERGSTALMFSITILFYGLVAPAAGGMVDRFGPRLVLPVGACIMGGGLVLCSLATTQWHFYLYYGVIAAVGLSIAGWTPLTTMISKWFVKKRGLIFGILAAAFGASLPSVYIAQFLISSFGWQSAYVIIGLVAIIIIVPLCAIFLRRSPQEKGLLPDGMPQVTVPHKAQTLDQPVRQTSLQRQWAGTTWTLSRALRTRQFWLLFLISFCLMGFAEQTVVAHQVYFFRDADVSGCFLQCIWYYVRGRETMQFPLRSPGEGNGFYTGLLAERWNSVPTVFHRRHVPTLDALLVCCLFRPGIRSYDTRISHDGS